MDYTISINKKTQTFEKSIFFKFCNSVLLTKRTTFTKGNDSFSIITDSGSSNWVLWFIYCNIRVLLEIPRLDPIQAIWNLDVRHRRVRRNNCCMRVVLYRYKIQACT